MTDLKCFCPMGGDRICPDNCPIAVWTKLQPEDRKAQRKTIAERLYKQGFTQEQIAAQLSVGQATIARDLFDLFNVNKSKAEKKTTTNPKGAGRPKGRKAAPQRDKVQDVVEALVRAGKPVPRKKLAAEFDVSERTVENADHHAHGRVEAEPQIRPEDLSMTARDKLNASIRQHQAKLDTKFNDAVSEGVRRFLMDTTLPKHREEQQWANRIMAARKGVMDKATFNKIRRCLHPDSRGSVTDRTLAEAFDAFMALEKLLLDEKDSPTNFQSLPNTWAEWEAAKQRAASNRRRTNVNSALRQR